MMAPTLCHHHRPGPPPKAFLSTTGDHDDRVVPLHSHKLTATLQHVLAGEPGPLAVHVVGWHCWLTRR